MTNGKLTPQDLENATDLKCEECSGNFFVPVFVIKHLSALASPYGQEINVPLQTFACAGCGQVNKEFLVTK